MSDAWPADLSVRPAALRAQLGGLVRRGYRGATLSAAVHEARNGKVVCVTFDDAYASVVERAQPVLADLGLPATVFVPTAFIGSGEPMAWPGIDGWLSTPHRRELVPMSWHDLARLHEHGWEIGSHTWSHPHLTRLTDDELERELVESKRELESRLGVPCRSLAYPYGDHDRRVVEAAARAGYTTAGTLPVRFVRPTALTWPRVGVYHGDGAATFALKVSPIVRAVRGTAAWNVAYGAVRALR